MIVKDPREVIHRVSDLEEYLDQYLRSEKLTFEVWAARFEGGFYRDRNMVMLEMVAPLRPRNVLEFACAGPFLARMLLDHVPSIERYTCTNFSRRMVDFCAAQLGDNPRSAVAVIDADVRRSEDMRRERLMPFDMFITTSLEHIQFDRELIGQFPVESAFVFSVARFDDPEHFRVYESPADIRSRYGDLLRIVEIRENREGNKLVVAGIRAPLPASARQ